MAPSFFEGHVNYTSMASSEFRMEAIEPKLLKMDLEMPNDIANSEWMIKDQLSSFPFNWRNEGMFRPEKFQDSRC